MPGRLELRGLRCLGRHGEGTPAPAEQVYLVDVTVELDLGPVAASDDFSDGVDLAELAASVRRGVGGAQRKLLETVAVETARLVLDQHAQLSRVRLRLSKSAPAGLGATEEAVEVAIERS